MKQNQPNFFIMAAPLLLVLFIDGMGLGLVVPVLNGLIFDPNSTFLSKDAFSPTLYNVIYGGIIGIFMFSWFFGAAILGDLSDQIGRKKSLIICLVGAFFSYIISAWAVSWSSLFLLIAGRVIAGFTSGSQPIAQAAIIDMSTPDTKTRNIGYILLTLSLGFIFGPLLGGILADSSLVSWFDFSTPFYFAAIISFLNIILLYWLFDETYVARKAGFSIKLSQAFNIFVSAFKNENVRILSILFFIYVFGWSSFYSFISLYLLKIYHFTSAEVSFYMALMGVGFGIANGFLANYLAKRFELRNIFIVFTLLSSVIISFMLFINNVLFNWIIIIPIACSVSVAYVSILSLFSDQVDEHSQGWVMGVTGSVMAFDWGLNGLLVGLIATWSTLYPIIISAVMLLLAGICGYCLSSRIKTSGIKKMVTIA